MILKNMFVKFYRNKNKIENILLYDQLGGWYGNCSWYLVLTHLHTCNAYLYTYTYTDNFALL